MGIRQMHRLNSGYTSEVDTVDEQEWYQILQEFNDANVHQTYAAAVVASSRRNISHLILRKNGEIVAAAQARITRIPLLNVGAATIQSGPLWKRGRCEPDPEVFRQAVRALRNEYVCARGLALRLFPDLYSDDDAPRFSSVLAQEGFSIAPKGARKRTIVMDLRPSLEELYGGLGRNWKKNLKATNKGRLELIEGTSVDLFDAFLGIYKEMVSRKKFVSFADINKFRQMQVRLPQDFKMIIMLGKSGDGLCAGLVCAAMGKSAINLFAATSNAGMKSRGSYFLQWKLIERLKEHGFALYDLDGIDPIRNPGTYKFKRDLGGVNGRDVYLLGRFDSHPGLLSYACVNLGETLKGIRRNCDEIVAGLRYASARVKG